MNFNKNFNIYSLIFLIFSTILLGIIPITNNNNDSKILDNTGNTDEILTVPKLQNSFDSNVALWWNKTWSYRVNVNVTANGTLTSDPINFTNRLVETNINFSAKLHLDMGEYGEFYPDSVRVIESKNSTEIIGEIPSQFDQATGYDPDTNAIGEISWVLNGITNSSDMRYFFIYFDVVESGVKPAPNYNLGLSLTENTPMVDYTLENDKLKVSMDNTERGGYSSHIYEVINKDSGIDQQRADYKWGWVLNSWSYGGIPFSISRIDVVSDGPIKKTVKMVQDTANFLYERFYTVNYIDDTVHIKHEVTAKTTLTQGTWQFASWWYPGIGGTNKELIDSRYGHGGFDFSDFPADLIPGLGVEFTDAEYLSKKQGPNRLWNKQWNAATIGTVKNESWFVHWNYLNNESVGTVWDNYNGNWTQFNKFGYHDGVEYEGSSIYLEYNPPGLAQSGDSFEFNVWGIIYNETDTGLYTKNRADGLQDRPLISPLGECQAVGKALVIHTRDRDEAPIEGAKVELYNITAAPDLLNDITTNSFGNATFRGLTNSTYNVSVYYQVNQTRFWIKNETIDILPSAQRKIFRVLDCNLTTVNILASDYDSGSSLFEVDLTIWNSTGGYIIEKTTDINGWISQKLPADDYNISAFYQGSATDLKLDISVLDFAKTQNFTLSTIIDINATLDVTATATILTFEYVNNTKTWDFDNDTSIYPYNIRLYKNDTVNVTICYREVQSENPISGATPIWNLTMDGTSIDNSTSSTFKEIGTTGNYSTLLYSCDYNNTGIYLLKINLNKTLTHQDAIIYIGFEIKNHTSQVQKIDADLNVYWNQNITILVNYTTVLPKSANISLATVNYSIIGTPYKFNMTGLGGGNYSLEFNTSVLELGTYEIFITANKTYIDLATKTISFTVSEIPTSISWAIDNDFEVTSTFLKIARGEFASIIVNYSIDSTGFYIGPASSVSTLIANVTSVVPGYPSNIKLVDLSDGRYNLILNASQFYAGDYEINFICYEEHHEDQTQIIILRILDYWDTNVDLIVPPSYYPWSNNASFIINYYCTEDPRTNRLLSGANINAVNIYVKIGQVFQFFKEMGIAELGDKWGYFDLESDPIYGAGYYLVWFNTSYVNVSETTAFYVSPTLNKEFYETFTYNPYVWIRPVYTILTPESDRSSIVPVKQFSLYLDQTSEITVMYNISDVSSIINGQLINGATVTYELRNNSITNELVKSGSFNPIDVNQNPGEYRYTLTAELLGNFTLSITAFKENYSVSTTSIDFFVDKKPINYTLSENIRGTVFSTPQNIPVSIALSLFDVVHQTTLSGATIEVIFEGETYSFHEDPDNLGIYTVNFNNTMLLGVIPDQAYQVEIEIIKTNYTTEEFILSLDIGLPVDPLLGIPYTYWILIGTILAIVVGAFGTFKYVQYRRIPEFIKKLNKVKKAIKRKKSISETITTETKIEYMVNSLGKKWDKLGINLKEVMGISEKDIKEIGDIKEKNEGGLDT